MKKILLLATMATALVTACKKIEQQPKASITTGKLSAKTSAIVYTNESDLVTSLSPYGFLNPVQISYNRFGTTQGYNTGNGFNIPATLQAGGFKWNQSDQDTYDWRPQGICGFNWGGRRFLLVSWYATLADTGDAFTPEPTSQHKGSRISIIDITNMSDIKYRHILLVQRKSDMSNSALFHPGTNPYTQGDLYCAVTSHASGVAYFDGKIYLAETSIGVRVFDLNKMVDMAGGATSIGKQLDGSLTAFDYGYILPQTGWYDLNGSHPYSSLSMGGGGTRLFTAPYYKNDPINPAAQITGYSLDAAGQISTGTPVVLNIKDDDGSQVTNIQGVFRQTTTQNFMSLSGKSLFEGSTSRLLRYKDGDAAGVRFSRWPYGSQNLYYEGSTGLMWCLTEYETRIFGQESRCVFAVRLSDYD